MARVTLERNAKFKSLVRRLGVPKPFVRGLLETLWDVAHECGNPVIGTADDVEASAEWPKKKGVFFEAMKDLNWIDLRDDGKWEIHDYWHHAPEYVKGRRRKEEKRKRDKGGNPDHFSGLSTPQIGCNGDSSINNDLREESPGHSRTSPKKSDTPTPTPTRAPAPTSPPAPEGDEELSAQVNLYVQNHPMLMWSAKNADGVRKLVQARGWPYAERCVDEGVKRGKKFPVSYALGMLANEERAESGADPPREETPEQYAARMVAKGKQRGEACTKTTS